MDAASPQAAEPKTGIVIPVHEADALVVARTAAARPQQLPRENNRFAHITLLAPFYPADRIDDAVVHHLTRFFAEVVPFGFDLTEVCEFPGGITYLSPEPATTFRRLTQQLHHEFPDFPPYGGAFDDVVPHLTVPLAGTEDTEDLRRALTGVLPLRAHAVEAALVQVVEGDLNVIVTLPFGTSAA